jgi:hypothetical protein
VETQRFLQAAFTHWGRPQQLRVDNGTPWGSWNDLPTELALWLRGLGVEVVANPPRRPEDNGVVERSQGTGQRWAEPGACDSPAELQAHLEEMDRIQRELYPLGRSGRSRQEAYPGLAFSGRPYSRRWERGHWDLGAVDTWLGTFVVPRRVDCQGKVSVYGRKRFVGKRWAQTEVYVGFNPEGREWTFRDRDGRLLQKQAAPELTRERIRAMRVTPSEGGDGKT